jgi:hypothetical protein
MRSTHRGKKFVHLIDQILHSTGLPDDAIELSREKGNQLSPLA